MNIMLPRCVMKLKLSPGSGNLEPLWVGFFPTQGTYKAKPWCFEGNWGTGNLHGLLKPSWWSGSTTQQPLGVRTTILRKWSFLRGLNWMFTRDHYRTVGPVGGWPMTSSKRSDSIWMRFKRLFTGHRWTNNSRVTSSRSREWGFCWGMKGDMIG